MPKPNPIHTDPSVQHIDVRLYFDRDEYTHADLVDKVAETLGNAPELSCMISAYELRNDGFSHLTPDDAPLA